MLKILPTQSRHMNFAAAKLWVEHVIRHVYPNQGGVRKLTLVTCLREVHLVLFSNYKPKTVEQLGVKQAAYETVLGCGGDERLGLSPMFWQAVCGMTSDEVSLLRDYATYLSWPGNHPNPCADSL